MYHETNFSRHQSVFNIIPLLLSSTFSMRQRHQYGNIMWRVSIDKTEYPAPVDKVVRIDHQNSRKSMGASPIQGDACAYI